MERKMMKSKLLLVPLRCWEAFVWFLVRQRMQAAAARGPAVVRRGRRNKECRTARPEAAFGRGEMSRARALRRRRTRPEPGQGTEGRRSGLRVRRAND